MLFVLGQNCVDREFFVVKIYYSDKALWLLLLWYTVRKKKQTIIKMVILKYWKRKITKKIDLKMKKMSVWKTYWLIKTKGKITRYYYLFYIGLFLHSDDGQRAVPVHTVGGVHLRKISWSPQFRRHQALYRLKIRKLRQISWPMHIHGHQALHRLKIHQIHKISWLLQVCCHQALHHLKFRQIRKISWPPQHRCHQVTA